MMLDQKRSMNACSSIKKFNKRNYCFMLRPTVSAMSTKKMCPDGTMVERDLFLNNCEFKPKKLLKLMAPRVGTSTLLTGDWQ